LVGTRQEHEGEAEPKGIIVNSGATFNIYGEPRLAWTKLTKHIRPPTIRADGILFEHKVIKESERKFGQRILNL
jgi:hypothetical protein